MASGSDILHDLNGRALRYRGRVPELLKKEIEKYTAQVQDDDSIDWIALLTLAGCYERLGNFPQVTPSIRMASPPRQRARIGP
jgi:hypothetical protein